MAWAAVRSKAIVLLLLILCLLFSHCLRGLFVLRPCFCYTVHGVLSSFAIILMVKREFIALSYLFSWCIVTVSFLWPFLTVPWVGLQYMIVVIIRICF